MPNSALIRCMGPRGASSEQRKMCNACRRLPRNRDDEDAEKWEKCKTPCERFIGVDPTYLARHPEGK